ncbi:4Fe-4S dicluster domain-containing protein [Alicyclobacillaceae bacterium I2511]|jgi:2-oxoglutarate ferredoxin oxidoreductase subunit delta|nr:4Fe-4S dicluster domain-containing protein [Alicyclobacillaceae bacterium I2511]
MMSAYVEINVERCKGCGICVSVCPTQVLELSKETNSQGYATAVPVHPEACTGCRYCALMCPDVAIKVLLA